MLRTVRTVARARGAPASCPRVAAACPIVRVVARGGSPRVRDCCPIVRPTGIGRIARLAAARRRAQNRRHPARHRRATHGSSRTSRRHCSAWKRCCGAAPRPACTTTRRPRRAGAAALRVVVQPRERHAGGDRHAGRARRQRRPGHAGLAVPRRARVVRRHAHRDGAAAERASSSTSLEVRAEQPLRHARPARHGRTPTASRCTPGRATCSCTVRIAAARRVAPERLRALVEDGYRCSPDAQRGAGRGAGGPAHRASD